MVMMNACCMFTFSLLERRTHAFFLLNYASFITTLIAVRNFAALYLRDALSKIKDNLYCSWPELKLYVTCMLIYSPRIQVFSLQHTSPGNRCVRGVRVQNSSLFLSDRYEFYFLPFMSMEITMRCHTCTKVIFVFCPKLPPSFTLRPSFTAALCPS